MWTPVGIFAEIGVLVGGANDIGTDIELSQFSGHALAQHRSSCFCAAINRGSRYPHSVNLKNQNLNLPG